MKDCLLLQTLFSGFISMGDRFCPIKQKSEDLMKYYPCLITSMSMFLPLSTSLIY